MTLAQQATEALKRAKFCKPRKKATEPHYHEAILAVASQMAIWNQSQGHHYTRDLLRAIRPATTKRLSKKSTRKQGRG